MKKAVCLIFVLLFLTSCSPNGEGERKEKETPSQSFVTGVWISCYELGGMLDSGNFKEEFSAAAKNIASINATDAFVHVRAFSDSLFYSDYYPQNSKTLNYDFDVLEFMINELKGYNIRFHAWINPFRAADGGFYNPADETVRKNIISGVREIVDKYSIDGIHFDDYFYNLSDNTADADTFALYTASGENTATIEQYRTSQITSLIFSVKNAIKYKNEKIIFSVSPAADMEKNQNSAFADIPYWCQSGAVDWIIPQLYFGFDYPDEKFRFENLLEVWRKMPRADTVSLIIGLASYKLGTDKAPDNEEWAMADNILSRQTAICKAASDISGVSFFSYSSLFSADGLHTSALSKIRSALK